MDDQERWLSLADWFADAVLYEVYPQSFADSNGDGSATPRYGTNDDMVELVAKARERGT